MIFTPENAARILACPPQKTQTRRLWKSHHVMLPGHVSAEGGRGGYWVGPAGKGVYVLNPNGSFRSGQDPVFRLVYYIGQTLAVQPGRGQRAIGRIRIVDIRRERLQDITEEDARAEGCVQKFGVHGYRTHFAALWDTIHNSRGAFSWQRNPEVAVLTFEVVR